MYGRRIRDEFSTAFEESHTPHEVAGSFAIGVFITALPSLGFGLLVFAWLVTAYPRISKVAIFSSVIVLNPVIKSPVYYASYRLGDLLLGTDPIVLLEIEVFNWIIDLTLRFMLGNVLTGLFLAASGYVVVRHFADAHQRRKTRNTVDLED